MYLKQLEKWSDKKWSDFFSERLAHFTEQERLEIKQILTLPTKSSIESQFKVLWGLGVLNGIGAWWFPGFLRKFITWLFPFIKWEWHDISYLIADSWLDRLKADQGLKKYSFASIEDEVEEAEFAGNDLYTAYQYLFAAPIKYTVAYLFFLIVRAFGFLSVKY